MRALFVPGWGASAALYRAALPAGWEALEPPSFRASGGRVEAHRDWLRAELAARPGPVTLGGHSLGAALVVLAAAGGGVEAERLVLVDPAGLPLAKSNARCALAFSRNVASGLFPAGEAAAATARFLRAPRAALRLAHATRTLDLRREFEQVRRAGVRCTVVASATDTLTPPDHCRRIAALAGAEYRELRVPGGHVWFLAAADLHRRELA